MPGAVTKRTTAGPSFARRFQNCFSTSSTSSSSVRFSLIYVSLTLTSTSKATIQNLILFVAVLPVYEAAKQPHTSLETSDYVLFVVGLAINAIEFLADNQHQSFHKYKATGKIEKNEWIGVNIQWTPEDGKRGFITKGLWAWSRHPNFVCEQLCWVSAGPIFHTPPLFTPRI
jgi:steroid 5-alpha reductase family enzyme